MTFTLAKWSLDDYHAMVEAGVLVDRHVELIHGDIVEMVPEGPEHTYREESLGDRLRDALRGRACVRIAKPITLDDSEPEPDIAIAIGSHKSYEKCHPAPDDLLVVIEISDSTLRRDITRKRDLYAQAGIPEYWVVDLQNRRLEIFRSPDGETYTDRRSLPDTSTEAIALLAFPDCTITPKDIFS